MCRLNESRGDIPGVFDSLFLGLIHNCTGCRVQTRGHVSLSPVVLEEGKNIYVQTAVSIVILSEIPYDY